MIKQFKPYITIIYIGFFIEIIGTYNLMWQEKPGSWDVGFARLQFLFLCILVSFVIFEAVFFKVYRKLCNQFEPKHIIIFIVFTVVSFFLSIIFPWGTLIYLTW